MPQPTPDSRTTVHLLLDDWLFEAARAGEQRFLNHLIAVLEGAGHRVELHRNGPLDRMADKWRGGRSLSHVTDPPQRGGLTFRRCYAAPFWQIERRAARWERDVTARPFNPSGLRRARVDRFFDHWRERLFPGASAARREGFLYMPLQGKLLRQRSFQTCSPLDMIERSLARDPRPIVATLHPKERYTSRERDALADIAARNPRFEMSEMPMADALAACDAVITQNSSVAFAGFFHAKPAVLFAEADFHHIASSVRRFGEERAFARLAGPDPDFATYLFWFLQRQSINAARPEAPERIAERLRELDWPV